MQRQVSKRTADRQRSAASGRGQVETKNEGEEVCKFKVNQLVTYSRVCSTEIYPLPNDFLVNIEIHFCIAYLREQLGNVHLLNFLLK